MRQVRNICKVRDLSGNWLSPARKLGERQKHCTLVKMTVYLCSRVPGSVGTLRTSRLFRALGLRLLNSPLRQLLPVCLP